MKIGVLIPSHDTVPFDFAHSLAQMAAFTASVMPEDTELGIIGLTGTYTHDARTQLMEHALADELDYALWVDSDMTFPAESLVQLLQHQVPMVGINYSTREPDGDYVAIKRVGPPGEKLITNSESEGLEEVEGVGFGMVLMRLRDFRGLEDIPAPWFFQKWLQDEQQFMGEDIVFCQTARDALGVRIFVDHDLSQVCGHVGTMTYRLQHLEAIRGPEIELVRS